MASLPLLRTTGSAAVQLPNGNDGVDRGNLFDDARDVLGVEQAHTFRFVEAGVLGRTLRDQ